MSDPISNLNLELACSVESITSIIEALEDGADINFNEGAPLFLAIVRRNRKIISLLLSKGADPDRFISKKRKAMIQDQEDLVDELISYAPYDPKLIQTENIMKIDDEIKSDGVQYLISNLDWDWATQFRDSLNAIGAVSSHRCVAEFLQWAKSENGIKKDKMESFLDKNSSILSEYRDRYISSGENLMTLANEYVKEMEYMK